ncbi:SGNH/GDSL hydrolase family protein [Actinoplanes sp. CA-030573]|uniref:SGNH/GDSL hydrolase family protein n=1 Tax=Actinoplanes sp. CA-030573 TaxID=3239898 RepID=UPI003D93EA0C
MKRSNFQVVRDFMQALNHRPGSQDELKGWVLRLVTSASDKRETTLSRMSGTKEFQDHARLLCAEVSGPAYRGVSDANNPAEGALAITNGVSSGWAWDPDTDSAVDVQIVVDDAVVGTFPASGTATGQPGYVGGKHGYLVDLNSLANLSTDRRVQLYALDVDPNGKPTGAKTLLKSTKAANTGLDYAHMGDSYAAGPGAGDYKEPERPCFRSKNSWGELFFRDPTNPWRGRIRFTNVACSGAITDDVILDQVKSLTPKVDRVTLSIGGNDVGFGSIAKACRLPLGDCTAANNVARTRIARTLPGALDNTYKAIFDATSGHAKIVITGYPLPFNASVKCSGGLSSSDRSRVNETIRQLDNAIADAVTRFKSQYSADVVYVATSGYFEGHRLCDGGDEWIANVVNADVKPEGIYHPNAGGHLAYHQATKGY